ncbi:hypothetical protein ABFX02_01G091300 [Erythranthe guttata]
MASKKNSPIAHFFLVLNLLFFFTLAISSCRTCADQYKPKPKPMPMPIPIYPSADYCPKDTLKLGVCANLLAGLLGRTNGIPPKTPCCSLIADLDDYGAALCLCDAVKKNVLGKNLNAPLSISLLLNVCSKKVPKGYTCYV